ncbi:MAG: NAD-binding protein, partial [Pseudomonadota bacterium]
VADSEYRHQLETDVMPFKGLLLGLFFIAVGMSANVSLLLASPVLVVLLTLALVAIKLLTFFPVLRLLGYNNADAWRTTTLLSQGGEFAFVLLTTALTSALVEAAVVELAVLVVTLSMATTPFLMLLANKLLEGSAEQRDYDEMPDAEDPVIIAGFGRFGQIVGRVLTAQRCAFTALDVNPGQVDFVRDFGNEVFYGDATRLDLLNSAGAKHARAIVIAVDDVAASTRIAETLRETYPDVPLLARARNRQHEIKLRDIGVHYVVRETLLSSMDLTRELFRTLQLDVAAVDAFAEHDKETLARQAAVLHDPQAYRQTTIDASAELRELFMDDKTTA